MKIIKIMPKNPEINHCKKHGDYESKYIKCFSDKIFVNNSCNDCIVEADKKFKIDEENRKKIEHDEWIKNKREKTRIEAGISKRNRYKTFDDYICKNDGQKKAKSDCQRYIKNFPCEKSMIMVGRVGTGKTLLASAIIEELVDHYNCKIIKIIDLIRELKSTWAKDSETTEKEIIDHYSNIDLLIVDEVGSQFGSDTEKLFIFDIIDGRYQKMKPTMLISNLDITGIKDAIGERCVDRLRDGGGSMIAFDWKSSRS